VQAPVGHEEEGLEAVGAAGGGAVAGVHVLGPLNPILLLLPHMLGLHARGPWRRVRDGGGVNCRWRVASEAGLRLPTMAPPSLRAALPGNQEERQRGPLVQELKAEEGSSAGGEE
jgi:hypothetical protein